MATIVLLDESGAPARQASGHSLHLGQRTERILYGSIFILALFAGWEAVTLLGVEPPIVLPSPQSVVAAFAYRIRQTVFATLIGGILAAGLVVPRAALGAPVQITISHSQKTADFLPLWIASDAGYFKKHGVEATVRYLPAQEGIPALLTNQVQIAGIGGSDASSAEVQGAKLKLVATLTPIYTFQFWARPQYANAGALKGQRIAVTSTTGSLYSATLLALKQLDLRPTDVIITPLGGVTNVNAALLAGSIAAACSHPPATYKFQQAGLVDLVDLAKKNIPSVSAGFG